MTSVEELYLDFLDEQSGKEGTFTKITEDNVSPPLFIVTYTDIPESGMLTTFTIGLSSIEYEEWTQARPELLLAVESHDEAWGYAVGYTAARARGRYGFHLGDTINFNAQIAPESAMSAFLIWVPSIVRKEQATIPFPGRTITMLQLIPIYDGEMRRIRDEGWEWFIQADPYVYDVRREDLSRRH